MGRTERGDEAAFAAVILPTAAALPAKLALSAMGNALPTVDALAVPLAVGCALAVLGPFLRSRGYREAGAVANALLVLTTACLLSDTSMFAALSLGRHVPYADATLSAWDAALGFRWADYATVFDRSETLWIASKVAYVAMFPQVPLAIIVLAYAGRARRLYAYMGASALSLMACFVAVAFFPALGGYAHAGGASAGFAHGDFVVADCMTATLERLRAGLPPGPRPEVALISFPSYHAVCAVLGAWAFWPVRRLRWIVLATDAAMLAATPVQGSHYLVDVIAGIAVAAAALAATSCAIRLASRRAASAEGPSWSPPPTGAGPSGRGGLLARERRQGGAAGDIGRLQSS